MSKEISSSTVEADGQKDQEKNGKWRRSLIALLFLLFSFLCLFCSSQGALYFIDREKILGEMRSAQRADYSLDAEIELAPLDRERLLTEVASDDTALEAPATSLAGSVGVVPLPEETLLASVPTIVPPIPTLTPTPTSTPTPTPTLEPTSPPEPTETPPPTVATTVTPPPIPTTVTPPPVPTTVTPPPIPTTVTPPPVPTTVTPPPVPTTVTPPPVPTTVTPSPPDNESPDARNDTLTLAEDSGPATINVLANDDDPDGNLDPPIQIISGPSSGQIQVNAQTGDITYTPPPNFFGTVTVVYRICDNDDDCSTATLTIIVTPVPEPPIAVDDLSPTLENTAVIIPVLNNDSDPDGDPLAVTAVVTTGNGIAVINPNNTVTYTPALNFAGTDIFTYTISDGLFTDMARVTIPITPTNSPPVAQPDGAGTAEDTPEIIQVLANDTDPDGDPLTVIAVGTPLSGTATTDGNIIDYIPFLDAYGTDVFTYTISDGFATSTTTVTVIITNSNDLPQASDDAYIGSSPLNQPAPGVLGNDNDPDGDALTALLVTPPVTGTLVLNSDGSFVYTVAASGTYTFTYQAQDSVSSSNVATVILTIP